MDNIISDLIKLGFSKTEAEVYIILLKDGRLTGYQIAKKMSVSRASVYNAVNNLYQKGIITLIPGETNIYEAEEPENYFAKLKEDYVKTTESVKESLASLKKVDNRNRFYNIEGKNNIISKAKELFLSAEKEIYLNTDFDLRLFTEELNILEKRGVRIIVFSFDKLDIEGLPIEMYHYPVNTSGLCDDIRLMMVVDYRKALIANTEDKIEYFGTFTENKYLIAIIAEHIHHDIYLLKLNQKHGGDLVTKDILIDSLQENRHERSLFLAKDKIRRKNE